MSLTLWLGTGYFVYKELIFLHQYGQICNPSQMFIQLEAISGHILEPCTNFRGLKELVGKLQSLV